MTLLPLDSERPAVAHPLRMPCKHCGAPAGSPGYIRTAGSQDVVRCKACDRAVYNAPKTETGRAVRSLTTVHEGIKPSQHARIIERAHGRCEECGVRGELQVGHIVAVKTAVKIVEKHPELAELFSDQHVNSDDNLIASCGRCNQGRSCRTMPSWLVVGIFMARLFEERGQP